MTVRQCVNVAVDGEGLRYRATWVRITSSTQAACDVETIPRQLIHGNWNNMIRIWMYILSIWILYSFYDSQVEFHIHMQILTYRFLRWEFRSIAIPVCMMSDTYGFSHDRCIFTRMTYRLLLILCLPCNGSFNLVFWWTLKICVDKNIQNWRDVISFL